MKILIELVIVLLVINTIKITTLTLQSTNLCRIFNTVNLNQKNDECIGRLKYKCAYDYCSLDQKTCEIFQKIYTITRSFFKIHYSENRIITYKKFINTVKSCPIRKEDLANLKYNMCFRDETCVAQKEIKWNNMSQLLTKKVVCPCTKKYGFDCGKEMCAQSRYDCMTFKLLKKIKSGKQYKSCQNGNIIYNLKY